MAWSAVPLVGVLFQEILEPGRAPFLEVSLLVAVVAFATKMWSSSLVLCAWPSVPQQSCYLRGLGLEATRGMSGQIHQDE